MRNIAIIAHVDHGKTTITDAVLRFCGAAMEGASMDSNALEKERGITIYSKNASAMWRGEKINIVDTPGHSDFGSEVERVLRSIDSVVLVVDAQEGPMPQTRFVLKKSLELGLKPIVVLNKIDKPAADPDRAEGEVFDLFVELGATDDQADFTTIYAVGRDGIAKKNLSDEGKDIAPLLDAIVENVPKAPSDENAPLRFQPFNLAYDDFLGRMAVGRIYEGTVRAGETLTLKKLDGGSETGRVTKLFTFAGLTRTEAESAGAGDIVMIAGFPTIDIGETLCARADQEALPAIRVDEPTISLRFLVNDSPFAGRSGKFVTGQQLRARLNKELEVNVGLKIDFASSEYALVFGRGELHIAVLLENMRREGYEAQVSQPHVIIKEIDGVKSEPFEEVTIDTPTEYSGSVIEQMGKRKGVMLSMSAHENQTRMIFEMPTRGLLGYRGQFTVATRGEGVLCSRVVGFRPYAGVIEKHSVGSMVSGATGKALGYSLFNLQNRGALFVGAGQEVYEGQVIGNTSKGEDMTVNPTKGKNLTNMRASGSDDAIALTPPVVLDIEKGLETMKDDEYLEVTPDSVRIRKQCLTENDRVKAKRRGN